MSDLRGRNAPAGVSLGSTGRIIGAAMVAIVVCGVGAYTYETGVWAQYHPKQVVADNRLPSPTPAQ